MGDVLGRFRFESFGGLADGSMQVSSPQGWGWVFFSRSHVIYPSSWCPVKEGGRTPSFEGVQK